jgi:hypothetical protein
MPAGQRAEQGHDERHRGVAAQQNQSSSRPEMSQPPVDPIGQFGVRE